MCAAAGHPSSVALVAWQGMDGLLTEDYRHDLLECVRRLRLVIMVPRRWRRLLDAGALGSAQLLEKPFDGDELLASISRAPRRQFVPDGIVAGAWYCRTALPRVQRQAGDRSAPR
jgi:hypothetical protein